VMVPACSTMPHLTAYGHFPADCASQMLSTNTPFSRACFELRPPGCRSGEKRQRPMPAKPTAGAGEKLVESEDNFRPPARQRPNAPPPALVSLASKGRVRWKTHTGLKASFCREDLRPVGRVPHVDARSHGG